MASKQNLLKPLCVVYNEQFITFGLGAFRRFASFVYFVILLDSQWRLDVREIREFKIETWRKKRFKKSVFTLTTNAESLQDSG